MPSNTLVKLFTATILAASSAVAVTSYANDFVDPAYIIAGNFSASTETAQATVISWAKELAAEGPWSELHSLSSSPRLTVISCH